MSRIKQIVFYGLMVVMTLAVIEGMAQAAYYAAYGEFNGGGPDAGGAATETAAETVENASAFRLLHPYYGFTRREVEHTINRAPPPRREDGGVLIGLLGGSVSWELTDAFRRALEAWFRDNDIALRPVVLELADVNLKQPQQVIIVANTLALGGEYDIIVNLDGYNELVHPAQDYFNLGLSPFFPSFWLRQREGRAAGEKLLLGRVYALRQREQGLAAAGGARPWRWSALYGIVSRYLVERNGAEILALNHELAAAAAAAEYDLEINGPIWPVEPDDAAAPDLADWSRIALRVWYRSSVLLHELSRAAGAEYYHFQQPNQYVPEGKPLSAAELAEAYAPTGVRFRIYPIADPLRRRLGAELRQQGVNYYDLTQIFAGNGETLYRDKCCHLNARGNELLAASMVQRLAPALRRRAALAGVKVGGGGGVSVWRTARRWMRWCGKGLPSMRSTGCILMCDLPPRTRCVIPETNVVPATLSRHLWCGLRRRMSPT